MNSSGPESPQLTIRTMTDYLTASGAHQRYTIIHNMKSQLGRRRFAPYYQRARMTIRRFASGDTNALTLEIGRLSRVRREALTRADAAKSENNLRVIADYRDAFAQIRMHHHSQQFQPLVLEGVRISTEPTLSGTIEDRGRQIPCNVIIDCQSESPTDAEIDYALELLYRGSGLTHKTSPPGTQYWHPASGNCWIMARSSVRRWRDIEAAAREIALTWPTIR